MSALVTHKTHSLQNTIRANIKRFDVCALLKVLDEMGCHMNDLFFESNTELSSQTSFCESIDFFDDRWPKAKIVVNFGLLSINSPLPSYFRKKMDDGVIDAFLFTRFVHFFDHHIIKKFLETRLTESIGEWNWKFHQKQYLKLLTLNTTSTLWYLFQICFPELSVQVIKSPKIIDIGGTSTTLGKAFLGKDAFLGKKEEQLIPSFKIMLTSEETHTDTEIRWPVEVKLRLQNLIHTVLERTDIHFRIVLIIKETREIALLSSSTQLGYCRSGKSKDPLKIFLFSGYPQDLMTIV